VPACLGATARRNSGSRADRQVGEASEGSAGAPRGTIRSYRTGRDCGPATGRVWHGIQRLYEEQGDNGPCPVLDVEPDRQVFEPRRNAADRFLIRLAQKGEELTHGLRPTMRRQVTHQCPDRKVPGRSLHQAVGAG